MNWPNIDRYVCSEINEHSYIYTTYELGLLLYLLQDLRHQITKIWGLKNYCSMQVITSFDGSIQIIVSEIFSYIFSGIFLILNNFYNSFLL